MSNNTDEKINIFGRFKSALMTDETFHETEIRANRLGTIVMAASCIILGIILVLNLTGFFKTDISLTFGPLVQGIIETAAVTVICIIFRFDRWWLKWMLVIVMSVVYAILDGIFTHKAWILMVIPVIFSAGYFSRKLTIFTTVITSVLFFISALWGAENGLFDLNIVTLPEGLQMVSRGGYIDQAVLDTGFDRSTMVWDAFFYNYIPKWMLFFIVALISMNIARRGRNMVMRQHEKDIEDARIESELELARRIQTDMLETDFNGLSNGRSFKIFASMTPAKEVGGDFYDFFMIDETHLGLVIADVSGKGIPAALMMTRAMTLIRGSIMTGRLPAEVLSDVNIKLCQNNDEGMFVTAWVGVLDTDTGVLHAANAGHEYPLLSRAGRSFSAIKDKHCFVLGGMESAKYTGYETRMEPGDSLFLYTDGLPEAESASVGFFGMERLLEALNKEKDETPEIIIRDMIHSVGSFTGDGPQFDDLTMLCIKYSGHTGPLVVSAKLENVPAVTDHINKKLQKIACPDKVRDQINISVDEILSNIAKYAYVPGSGNVTVNAEIDDHRVCITFSDEGRRFNPLETEDPDIFLAAEERNPGGLGIYMVKKMMDEVNYEYRDGHNILKITKDLQKGV